MTGARSRRRGRRRTCSSTTAAIPCRSASAVLGGRATGVPGAVALLQLAHREHGRLAWRSLFGDAERTARDGFIVSPRLAPDGRQRRSAKFGTPDVRAYFSKPDGTLVQAGDRLRNPAYAEFLSRLAAQGADALYRGPTASRIVERTRAGPLGGTMTLAGSRGLPPAEARIAVPHLAGSPALRAAAAVERRRVARADADSRADRHRRARTG